MVVLSLVQGAKQWKKPSDDFSLNFTLVMKLHTDMATVLYLC